MLGDGGDGGHGGFTSGVPDTTFAPPYTESVDY